MHTTNKKSLQDTISNVLENTGLKFVLTIDTDMDFSMTIGDSLLDYANDTIEFYSKKSLIAALKSTSFRGQKYEYIKNDIVPDIIRDLEGGANEYYFGGGNHELQIVCYKLKNIKKEPNE